MRHGAVLLLASVLMAAIAGVLPAQSAASSSTAPFVSKLKAVAEESQVILSWKDSPDVKGAYLVYRSTAEITAENLDKAELVGSAPTGAETFSDSPPDIRQYFYAVLLRDEQGKLFRALVPFRNVTSKAVSVSSVAAEEQLASRVTGIAAAAAADGSGIEVSFTSSNPSRELIIFCGGSLMSSVEDLLRSSSRIQLDPGVQRWIVPLAEAGEYWFAVLDAGLFMVGKAPLERGQNATAGAVRFPAAPAEALAAETAREPTASEAPVTVTAATEAGMTEVAQPPRQAAVPTPGRATAPTAQSAESASAASATQGRPAPLPLLQTPVSAAAGAEGSESLPSAPPRKEVASSTEEAIAALVREAGGLPQLTLLVQVLPSEKLASEGASEAEESLLAAIVVGPLAEGKFAEAEKRLNNLLSLRRSADVEARAHFYLGQALWFQDRAREALIEFLFSESAVGGDIRKWEDACIQRLARS